MIRPGPQLLFFDFGRLRWHSATVPRTVARLGDTKEPHSLSDNKKKKKAQGLINRMRNTMSFKTPSTNIQSQQISQSMLGGVSLPSQHRENTDSPQHVTHSMIKLKTKRGSSQLIGLSSLYVSFIYLLVLLCFHYVYCYFHLLFLQILFCKVFCSCPLQKKTVNYKTLIASYKRNNVSLKHSGPL